MKKTVPTGEDIAKHKASHRAEPGARQKKRKKGKENEHGKENDSTGLQEI